MSKVEVRVDSERFLELIQKAKLVKEAVARKIAASMKDPVTGKLPKDTKEFADAFVKDDHITQWQANNLLRGKHKGFMLGRYQLQGLLGTGGMSSVYLAYHMLLRRQVAIKVLPPSKVNDSSYLARFHREGEAIAQLNHPNIVRAYDIDQDGKTHYFVMEYVDGPDFSKIIKKEGQMDFRRAADYIAQVAEGLQHAHDAGFIHRDIKPANCLVDSQNVVKVLDLGLTLFKEEEGPSLTIAHNENVLGTADFLSPEQAINSHKVDSRADIYSLGCTFYYLLTGHAPFPSGTISERLIKHQKEAPAPIRDDCPDIPKVLEAICAKMMRKSRRQRFQTCQEAATCLHDWLEGKQVANIDVTADKADAFADSDNDMASSKKPASKKSRPQGSSKKSAAAKQTPNPNDSDYQLQSFAEESSVKIVEKVQGIVPIQEVRTQETWDDLLQHSHGHQLNSLSAHRSADTSGTPAWLWVLISIAVALVVGLIFVGLNQ